MLKIQSTSDLTSDKHILYASESLSAKLSVMFVLFGRLVDSIALRYESSGSIDHDQYLKILI